MENTITIQTNYLRALMAVAPKKDIRYYLNGVHIETGDFGAIGVATDGHILVVVRLDETPRPESVIFAPNCWKLAGIKDESVALTYSLTNGESSLARCTLDHSGGQLVATVDDRKFPDWRRVVPKSTSLISSPIDSTLVAKLDTCAKHLDKQSHAIVSHGGPKNPALVSFTHYEDAFGVVMPTLGEQITEAPAWAAAPSVGRDPFEQAAA